MKKDDLFGLAKDFFDFLSVIIIRVKINCYKKLYNVFWLFIQFNPVLTRDGSESASFLTWLILCESNNLQSAWVMLQQSEMADVTIVYTFRLCEFIYIK